MSSASGIFSRPNLSGPYLVVEEHINDLVRKVNEFIIANVVLRASVHREMRDFNSEKIRQWIADPYKKWQDLPEPEKNKFNLPQTIDNLFHEFKKTIQEELKIKLEQEQEVFITFIANKAQEASENIDPTSANWYEHFSLTEPPSRELERAIKSVLSKPSVQSLDDMMLKQKFTQFWRAMEEGDPTSSLIIKQLQKIFEIDENSAKRIGPLFEKANPFKVKLAELLLNNQHDSDKLNACFQNRNICFSDGKVLRSFKIEHVTKCQKSSPNVPKFILEGSDGESVELEVFNESKNIRCGCWRRKIQVKLSQVILNLKKSERKDLLEVKCDDHSPDFELPLEGDYQVLFEDSKMTLDQAETENRKRESGTPKPRPVKRRKLDKLGRMIEGGKIAVDSVKNIFKSERLYEEFIFHPISEGEVKNEGAIHFRKYLNESNSCPFSWIINGREQPFAISLESFFSYFTAKIMEETPFQLSAEQQSKIHLTNFEPTTNEKIAKELKERTETELHAIDRLVNHNLNSIYHFLIEREGEDLFGEKSELYDLMYRNIVDKDPELKAQLFTLCRLCKIAHQSKEEAFILGNLIHRANIQQLCPNVKFSENPELIKMLGNAIEKSKNLIGKRGLILIGSTGSGKSTIAGYLMGIPMVEEKNRFGEISIKIDDQSNTENAPKIGFSLGISETTFAEQFALNSITEKEGEGEFEENVSVNFPPHISRDIFSVVDFPGFEDTRGTPFEIATHFSVDHSIKAMEAIDAIGLVIAYDVLTATRSSLLIDALRDLSSRFENCIDDPVLAKRIFILVTKQQEDINEDHLRERARDLLQEEENQEYPDELKCRLLGFFLNQCVNQRVILVEPSVPLKRIEILNRILKSAESSNHPPEQTLKHQYRTTLDRGVRAVKFSDSVNETIGVWKDWAFPLFLDKSEKEIEDEENLSRNEQGIKDKNDDIEKIKEKNQELEEELKKILTLIGKLKSGEEAQLSLDLSEAIQQNQKKETERMEEQFRTDKDQYFSALHDEDDCQNRLKKKKEELREIKDEINSKQREIEEKTKGVSNTLLHDVHYQPEDRISTRKWNPEIDLFGKRKRAADLGTDILSDGENESNYQKLERNLKETFDLSCIANIDRSFQLIPPDQKVDVLNDLIKGEKLLVLGKDGFQIHIESCKVKFDYIRHHRDGKQVTYCYQAMFDGQPPYPKLKITHVIPNRDLHVTEVRDLKNKIIMLEGKLAGCLKSLGEDRYSLNQAKKKSTAAEKAYLQIQSEKKKLESEAYQKTINSFSELYETQYKYIKMTIENNEKRIRDLGKEIWTLTQRIETYRNDLNHFKFKRQRWGLFIENHKTQLEHAIKMARFFVEANQRKQGEDGITQKLMRISEECKKFIQLYEQRKDELEEELKRCFNIDEWI